MSWINDADGEFKEQEKQRQHKAREEHKQLIILWRIHREELKQIAIDVSKVSLGKNLLGGPKVKPEEHIVYPIAYFSLHCRQGKNDYGLDIGLNVNGTFFVQSSLSTDGGGGSGGFNASSLQELKTLIAEDHRKSGGYFPQGCR